MTERALAVCADDFGISPAVTDAIIRSVRHGPVRAVSCLVLSPDWPGAAARIEELEGAEVGLHVAFTTFAPLEGEPVRGAAALSVRALLGRIDPAWSERVLDEQWARFRADTGRDPAYLDGHHHAHQFAGIRESVAAYLARRAPSTPVRISEPGSGGRWLARLWIGSQARRARRGLGSLPCTARLFGIHDAKSPKALLACWLDAIKRCESGDALMTHPGAALDPELERVDGYVALREAETRLLTDGTITEALARAGVRAVGVGEAARHFSRTQSTSL